jgi:hypothetical protein
VTDQGLDQWTSLVPAPGQRATSSSGAYRSKFPGGYEHRTISGGVGHNLPQEAPQAFAAAIGDVDRY